MTRRIVLASSNRGKLAELDSLLAPLGFETVAQDALGIEGAREDAPSFIENAIAKARHASAASGLAALADDSGLLGDALDGRPGVHSARFAGEHAGDADNVALLLQRLHGVVGEARSARFVCVVVMLRNALDPCPIICDGYWEGHIATRSCGDGGFGYDPVFQVAECGCSAAELGPQRKNAVSHRARALRALAARLGAG